MKFPNLFWVQFMLIDHMYITYRICTKCKFNVQIWNIVKLLDLSDILCPGSYEKLYTVVCEMLTFLSKLSSQ